MQSILDHVELGTACAEGLYEVIIIKIIVYINYNS